ncbi:MAG TPA: DMT family transporter [Bryobacteraceae bacterium]|jgi:drug/metabolite transporter (DMT)-like permease
MVHPSRRRAELAQVGVTFVWGATFVVVKGALQDSSTLLFLALRFTLATVALAAAFRPLASRFDKTKPILAGGALAGVFLFSGYLLQTIGLRYTTPSKSAFITGLCVVMVPVFSALVARRLPGASVALGVGTATVGMALLTLRGASLKMDAGDLLTLGGAAAFSIHIMLLGRLAPRLGFQALALTQIATAAVLALSTFWWVERPTVRWTPGLISALLVTGLLATAVAFSVQTWAQQYTTPTRTALIFAMEPVFAWLTSFVVAGEVLAARAALGAVLILAGILLVELKPLKRATGPL